MKISIHGINGRMGQEIAAAVLADDNLDLAAASVREEHAWAGKKLSDVSTLKSDLKVTSNLDILCQSSDVIIDFTRPDATLALLPVCQKYNCAVMIGTTGFTDEVQSWIHKMAEHLPIVLAANTSLGVNLLTELSKVAAKILAGRDWDVDIFEIHHRRKSDAPSGTALRLGKAVAEAQDTNFKERYSYPYFEKRKEGSIGFSVARGGDIIGEHTVYFMHDHERIELTHRAQDRSLFANGALEAAKWLEGKGPGLYGMADVLGFDR